MNRNKEISVAICAIARLENRYIKEWIDYHLDMGFEHIYIYDNNRDNEERIADVINVNCEEYKSRVIIIPFHDVDVCPQLKAYNHCYKNGIFDWIAFIDIDEFFTLSQNSNHKSVSDFINAIGDYDAILLNWKVYGDNGLLDYECKNVVDRFIKPLPVNFSVYNMWGRNPINRHVKTLIRNGLNMRMCSPHIGEGNYRCCNANGMTVNNVVYQNIVHDTAYLRHYITKSIGELIQTKGMRSAADSSYSYYPISSFFLYNKPTFRKYRIYSNYCKRLHHVEKQTLAFWLKCWIKMWIITPLFVK